MNFVNNWSAALTLNAAATSLALDLPDGTYRLTCSDTADALATRWEVVSAVVVGGAGTLTRALEGTTDQQWPAGSVIYCALTAGVLADLDARVSTLESAGGAAAYFPRSYVGAGAALHGDTVEVSSSQSASYGMPAPRSISELQRIDFLLNAAFQQLTIDLDFSAMSSLMYVGTLTVAGVTFSRADRVVTVVVASGQGARISVTTKTEYGTVLLVASDYSAPMYNSLEDQPQVN